MVSKSADRRGATAILATVACAMLMVVASGLTGLFWHSWVYCLVYLALSYAPFCIWELSLVRTFPSSVLMLVGTFAVMAGGVLTHQRIDSSGLGLFFLPWSAVLFHLARLCASRVQGQGSGEPQCGRDDRDS